MANPYPANFETLAGSRRLTGQIDFTDPTNVPGYTPPTGRQQVFGDAVNVNNAATGTLGWNHTSGDTLLDFTDPLVPTIITAGIYAVTVLVQAAALTTGGFFEVSFDMNLSGDDATLTNVTSPAQTAAARQIQVIASLTWYMPAGGDIKVRAGNRDGASTRAFSIGNATVQRIT